jgi:hypothetical protein
MGQSEVFEPVTGPLVKSTIAAGNTMAKPTVKRGRRTKTKPKFDDDEAEKPAPSLTKVTKDLYSVKEPAQPVTMSNAYVPKIAAKAAPV